MIGFNYPPRIPNSIKYITDIFDNRNSRGNGYYTLKCSEWLEKKIYNWESPFNWLLYSFFRDGCFANGY